MKANYKLINALRASAAKIADPDNTEYNWNNAVTCNCGILARELIQADNVCDLIDSSVTGYWQNYAERTVCSKTGQSISVLYNKLSECGLEQSDYELIEDLGEDSGYMETDMGFRLHVAKRMYEIANDLESQLNPSTVQQTSTQGVSV